jgi:WD40 repeat protein
MDKETKSTGCLQWLGAGVAGLLLGVCLALAVTSGIVIGRSQVAISTYTPTLYIKLFLTATSTPDSTSTPVPTRALTIAATAESFEQAIEEAGQLAQNGEFSKAQQQLTALLDQTNDLSKIADIYGMLGDLEIEQGHSRLATGYYDKQYAIQKTPATLLKLADTYNESGNLRKAESAYIELLNWPNKEADSYQEEARQKLQFVRLMLGTPIATPTSEGTTFQHPEITPTLERVYASRGPELPPPPSLEPFQTPTTSTEMHLPESKPLLSTSYEVINRTNLNRITAVSSYQPSKKLTSSNSTFAVSPDGKTIAFDAGNQIDLWNLWEGRVTQSISYAPAITDENFYPYLLTFSPDGKKLAGLADRPMLWDVTDGKTLWVGERPEDSIEDFTSISFSPDGKYIITSSCLADSRMRLWSVLTGKMIKEIGPGNQFDAAFSPDGKILLSANRMDGDIYVWDPNTWKQIRDIKDTMVVGLQFSPNGEILAGTLHWDSSDYSSVINIYQVKDWKLLGKIENKEPLPYSENMTVRSRPVFNSDGGIIAYAVGDSIGKPIPQIAFWDTLNQKKLLNLDVIFQTPVAVIKFSHDGRFLIVRSEDGTVQFYGIPKK